MVLSEHEVDPDPLTQLARWYEEAAAAMGERADHLVVATATSDGAPSARFVLLRGLDADGLRFYTSYESQKGRELAENPRAAAVLHWVDLGRQARVTGGVTRLDGEQSYAYWHNRPRASRISAWASHQSEPVASRAELEAAARACDARYPGDDVPLPPFWGGYLLTPEEVELWEHRDDRLHDRVRYRRDPAAPARWVRDRLAP